MRKENLEGFYWLSSENEYKLQIHFLPKYRKHVLSALEKWTEIGSGVDMSKKEEIIIFTKKTINEEQFSKMVGDLEKQENIILKEVT